MKKHIKTMVYIVMVISLVVCATIGIGRIQVEQNFDEVQIAIRYSDVLSIAQQTEVPIEDVLTHFKELGVNTLFVRENTVNGANGDFYSYKGQGRVSIAEGYILKYYYPEVEDLKVEYNYIVTEDENVATRIYQNFYEKEIQEDILVYKDYETSAETYFIKVGDFASALTTIGAGFNIDDLNLAASLGYTISPQIKNWSSPTESSINFMIEQLSEIDNLGAIYFADMEVPGASNTQFVEFMKDHQIGFIEFTSGNQKGLGTLVKGASENGTAYDMVRLHTITDAQLKTFTVPALLDRYGLALRERNNRVFLFKMPSSVNIEDDIDYLERSITGFAELVEDEGFKLTGQIGNYNLPVISTVMAILAGLAAIMAFILLCLELNANLFGYICGVIGIVGYVGLLAINATFASKVMALFGASIFPTYAIVRGISEEPRSLKGAVIAFLKICAISYGGVLTIVGTLSRTSFGLGIDLFLGVKIAHIVPIAAIVLILLYKKYGFDFKLIKKLLDKKISYGALLLIGIIGAALFIYASRTGNTGTASTLELQFRQMLTNILGVRPRTKEFLIGYPILMCLLYYGYKEMYLPFLIFAAVGPISLVNTYAHIHTPLLISMLRSVYGIVLGIVIGIIAIKLIQLIVKGIQKCQQIE